MKALEVTAIGDPGLRAVEESDKNLGHVDLNLGLVLQAFVALDFVQKN